MSSNDPKLLAFRDFVALALPSLQDRVTFMRQREASAPRFAKFPCATVAWGADVALSEPYERTTSTPADPPNDDQFVTTIHQRRRRTAGVEIYSDSGEAFDLAVDLRLALRRPEVLALLKAREIGLIVLSEPIDESGLRDTAWEDTVAIDFGLYYLRAENGIAPAAESVILDFNGTEYGPFEEPGQ
jgi:hypothetical protein